MYVPYVCPEAGGLSLGRPGVPIPAQPFPSTLQTPPASFLCPCCSHYLVQHCLEKEIFGLRRTVYRYFRPAPRGRRPLSRASRGTNTRLIFASGLRKHFQLGYSACLTFTTSAGIVFEKQGLRYIVGCIGTVQYHMPLLHDFPWLEATLWGPQGYGSQLCTVPSTQFIL